MNPFGRHLRRPTDDRGSPYDQRRAGTVGLRANISLRNFSRLEAGQRPNTSAVTLTRVALALETSVEYLLGDTDDARSIHDWRDTER